MLHMSPLEGSSLQERDGEDMFTYGLNDPTCKMSGPLGVLHGMTWDPERKRYFPTPPADVVHPVASSSTLPGRPGPSRSLWDQRDNRSKGLREREFQSEPASIPVEVARLPGQDRLPRLGDRRNRMLAGVDAAEYRRSVHEGQLPPISGRC